MHHLSTKLRSADVALNGVVFAALGAPLAMSVFALVASVAYTPEAVARQDHLAAFGVRFAPCPGCVMCGMSRAFSAFAHGDVSRAVALNPAVVVFFPLFVALVAGLVWAIVRLARSPIRLSPQPSQAPRAAPTG